MSTGKEAFPGQIPEQIAPALATLQDLVDLAQDIDQPERDRLWRQQIFVASSRPGHMSATILNRYDVPRIISRTYGVIDLYDGIYEYRKLKAPILVKNGNFDDRMSERLGKTRPKSITDEYATTLFNCLMQQTCRIAF